MIFQIFPIIVFLGSIAPGLHAIQKPDQPEKTVKIGLLISDKSSLAAWHGAEMAIRRANETGGFNGKPFQLVVRTMEGPWGTGSKEAVNLIFEENVLAILGSHDGRNAHLVEQVTTKARIVFLSSWASDPTLSQAFVPWYFSCVPTDLQQADALIKEIYNKRKLSKIAVVIDNGYDSKQAMKSFLINNRLAGKADPLRVFYIASFENSSAMADQLRDADIDGIIFFGKPSTSMRLIQQLSQRKMEQPVFGSLSLLDEDDFEDQGVKHFENFVLVSPGYQSGSEYLAFRNEFMKTYGIIPGAVAAYSFDGMSLLIEAIRKTGTNRDEIQKSMATIHFEGVTGSIQFDNKGKRTGTPDLMEFKISIPFSIVR